MKTFLAIVAAVAITACSSTDSPIDPSPLYDLTIVYDTSAVCPDTVYLWVDQQYHGMISPGDSVTVRVKKSKSRLVKYGNPDKGFMKGEGVAIGPEYGYNSRRHRIGCFTD